MAIYHFSAQIISRKAGRSSVAASAYRSASKMVDPRTGETHNYLSKKGVAESVVFAPKNAPVWMLDREKLWANVEDIEKRKDAQLCREINIALPIELSNEQKKALVQDFVKTEFVAQGMVCQVDLHDLNSQNPHAHIMCTLRNIDGDGFGKKNRDWNDRALLEHWRKAWADTSNQHLAMAGSKERIDHRTLAQQGVNRAPQIHLGQHALGYEKRNGKASEMRKHMEQQQLEHLAQQAAQVKIQEASASAIRDAEQAVEQLTSELESEIARIVAPTQASADIRRDLEQVRRDYRPAIDIVSARPIIQQAKKKVDQAEQQLNQAQARYVELEAAVPAAKKGWGKAKRDIEEWRSKHPLRLWLHEHVRPSVALKRLEKQLEDAEHSINAARRSANLAKQDVERSLSIYIKHRDEHISMQSESVQALNEQRKPTDLLIRRLEQALAKAQEREQQEQERITALQQEQERRNKLGVVLTPNSNNVTTRARQTPKS